MKPTLSVILLAYNIEPYIEESVRAILAQLRDHHELIVLNDGSTDNTNAVVTRLQQGWPGTNFHAVSQANEGVAGARNHGLRVAKGDYIVWIDGDDVLLEGVLALLDQAIEEHRPDVIAFDFKMWHPKEPHRTQYMTLGYAENAPMRANETILNAFFADRKTYLWNHVIRREIYTTLPHPIFPPGRVFEDVSTLPRLLSLCSSLLYLPTAIIDYRQHPSSITQSVSEKWCMDSAAALPLVSQYLRAKGVPESVRLHFDIMAGHFYLGVFKASYQLPRLAGQRVRASISSTFTENLFGDCKGMLAFVRAEQTDPTARKVDLHMIEQVSHALSGNLMFDWRMTASRKLKLWRQARKLRKYHQSLAAAKR